MIRSTKKCNTVLELTSSFELLILGVTSTTLNYPSNALSREKKAVFFH